MGYPKQLEVERDCLDRHVDGKPYGIDIVVPGKYSNEAEKTTGSLDALNPDGHKAYMVFTPLAPGVRQHADGGISGPIAAQGRILR